jgi:hypothetical protein
LGYCIEEKRSMDAKNEKVKLSAAAELRGITTKVNVHRHPGVNS